jgi:hypothetical protein
MPECIERVPGRAFQIAAPGRPDLNPLDRQQEYGSAFGSPQAHE